VDLCRSAGCGVTYNRTCSGSGTTAITAGTWSNVIITKPPADAEHHTDDSGNNYLGHDVDRRAIWINDEFV